MALTERQRQRQARARADWTPPGPVPPGDQGEPDLVPGPDETLDAFAGHWRLFQLRGGHRYSTDDLLGAWYAWDTMRLLDRTPANALDLGTGIGSVGLFVAWKYPALHLTGIEAQARSLSLARRSARYNGVAARARYLEGDLRELSMTVGAFELVTGSPPYWDRADGTVSDAPQKGPCRFEFRGGVEGYCEAARAALAPQGVFAVVFDGRQTARLEVAAEAAGLEIFRLREVVSREGDPPLIVVAAMARAGEAPWPRLDEPALLLRDAEGKRTDAFRALREAMGLPPGAR
ncbi:MAG TPA: methyltransferase [Pantanalinema sp.]